MAFPVHVVMVSDEYEQIGSEALEAARISANKYRKRLQSQIVIFCNLCKFHK